MVVYLYIKINNIKNSCDAPNNNKTDISPSFSSSNVCQRLQDKVKYRNSIEMKT